MRSGSGGPLPAGWAGKFGASAWGLGIPTCQHKELGKGQMLGVESRQIGKFVSVLKNIVI